MNKINDGGPAFPGVNEFDQLCGGMALRDYFAAKALQVEMATMAHWQTDHATWLKVVCERAYATADAMLNARRGVAVTSAKLHN